MQTSASRASIILKRMNKPAASSSTHQRRPPKVWRCVDNLEHAEERSPSTDYKNNKKIHITEPACLLAEIHQQKAAEKRLSRERRQAQIPVAIERRRGQRRGKRYQKILRNLRQASATDLSMRPGQWINEEV